jgi:hypothetical protein
MQKTFVTKRPCCKERVLSISEHASIHEAGGYILIDLTVNDLKNLERQITFEIALAESVTNQDHQNI